MFTWHKNQLFTCFSPSANSSFYLHVFSLSPLLCSLRNVFFKITLGAAGMVVTKTRVISVPATRASSHVVSSFTLKLDLPSSHLFAFFLLQFLSFLKASLRLARMCFWQESVDLEYLTRERLPAMLLFHVFACKSG